ncbi:cation efflux family-domain-containing protein [Pilobolus umbonatus]|nr:cation efflux family-domain-containing protein [Pilobolus umbonatus]
MTQPKPPSNTLINKSIVIQSSVPLYTHKQEERITNYGQSQSQSQIQVPVHNCTSGQFISPIDNHSNQHHSKVDTHYSHAYLPEDKPSSDSLHCHHSGHSQPTFSPVYTKPLPSWIQLFSLLLPTEKALFTWFLIHVTISVCLYYMGTQKESLSLIGYSYLMLFDALGVLNSFVSSILRNHPEFGVSNTKRPYGAHRYEIVFALGTTIYLLFATMHNTKESLEHFLLQTHHMEESHDTSPNQLSIGMFLLMGTAISATCFSSVGLRNHDNFVRYLRRRPTTVHGFSYNVINRARISPINAILSNIYSLSIVLCGTVILVFYVCNMITPFIDKVIAFMESVIMCYLGYPTAKGLSKVLLQTTPNTVQSGVDNRLREIMTDSNILAVNKVHFWQTTYGKCVGTIEITVSPEADEQAVLQLIYQKLEGLTSSEIVSDISQSELTVSIKK